LSTCNRTEIYGIAPDADTLINLLCSETVGDKDTFLQLAYIKQGQEAIEHIFSVGAGLDSQILGDYEIVGQMKLAIKQPKSMDLLVRSWNVYSIPFCNHPKPLKMKLL
jgi:glutamyl-tRNA reductase